MIISTVMCIALTVFHESRNQSIEGQMAVALVVRNRMAYENKGACQIAFAEKQFSWANKVNKSLSNKGLKIESKYVPDHNNKAWKRAQYIAIVSGKIRDFTNGSTHYHTLEVAPNWNLQQTMIIGDHIFYKRYAKLNNGINL